MAKEAVRFLFYIVRGFTDNAQSWADKLLAMLKNNINEGYYKEMDRSRIET